MILLDWINGRGFVNADHIVSAKVHWRENQLKIYVETVTGKEYQIQDPSEPQSFRFNSDWEKEGRKQLVALKKLIQGEGLRSIERKTK